MESVWSMKCKPKFLYTLKIIVRFFVVVVNKQFLRLTVTGASQVAPYGVDCENSLTNVLTIPRILENKTQYRRRLNARIFFFSWNLENV